MRLNSCYVSICTSIAVVCRAAHTGASPALLCRKWGCDSVYLVFLLSTFLWYSFVISLPMHVSLIPIMAKCTTATPPTLMLSLPHKLLQPPQHQPKASKQSSLWGGKMVACIAATNHWWGSDCIKLRSHLGLDSLQPYKWRLLCSLMDELQQNRKELQQCLAMIKIILNSHRLTHCICSMSGTVNAFELQRNHLQEYTADLDMMKPSTPIQLNGAVAIYVRCCVIRGLMMLLKWLVKSSLLSAQFVLLLQSFMNNFGIFKWWHLSSVIAKTEINRLKHTVFKTVQKITETAFFLKSNYILKLLFFCTVRIIIYSSAGLWYLHRWFFPQQNAFSVYKIFFRSDLSVFVG